MLREMVEGKRISWLGHGGEGGSFRVERKKERKGRREGKSEGAGS